MSALEWINKVCPHCETEYGTYSEGDKYGEHECDGIKIELLEENKRLKIFASGRGMVSEADSMAEVAVLVCGLYDKIEQLESELRDAKTNR